MATSSPDVSRGATPAAARMVWAGRILTGLALLALATDAAGKLFAPALMIASSPPLGLPADPGFYRLLGAILAVCTALYAWPRTAALGAVLLTGYLGGAVLAHLRVGSPMFTFTLVGVYLGVIVWAGLWLRDGRVRALVVVKAPAPRDVPGARRRTACGPVQGEERLA